MVDVGAKDVTDRRAVARAVVAMSRETAALVARGEAPLGIVYATDAAASRGSVRVVGTFPAGSHPPIVYPAALTATAKPGAGAFLAFLRGPEAAAAFARQGFALAGEARGA